MNIIIPEDIVSDWEFSTTVPEMTENLRSEIENLKEFRKWQLEIMELSYQEQLTVLLSGNLTPAKMRFIEKGLRSQIDDHERMQKDYWDNYNFKQRQLKT